MSSESARVKTESRTKNAAGDRRQSVRKATLRRLSLDSLEPRTLMATLPPSVANGSLISSTGTSGSASSPKIVIDPNHPAFMAEVWTFNDPNLAPGPTERVGASVSFNAGASWQPLNVGFIKIDPTTLGSNPPSLYAQTTDASAGFDRNDNLYILDSQHQATNGVGELLLNKYNLANGVVNQLFTNRPVYQWVADQAVSPTLVVDGGAANAVDTNTTSGQTVNQSDKYSGNVYVAWTAIQTQASTSATTTINEIRLAASSDGGNTFSGPITVGGSSNAFDTVNISPAGPALAVAQGSSTVNPGTLAVAWDQIYQGTGTPPPTDPLLENRLTDGAVTVGGVAAIPNGGFTITDAIKGANNAPDIPTPTDIPIQVTANDPRFLNLSNLTVNLGIVHPAIAELSIQLIPPPGSGLPTITLLNNRTDAANNNTGLGVTGANLGITTAGPSFGTTFDDNATRSLLAATATAPFVGHFRPEGGSINAAYQGATAAQINGRWTLEITDFRNGNVGSVRFASLSFASGLSTIGGGASTIANTAVRGNVSQNGFVTTSASNPKGIGPGLSIAFDNTLGAYSPNEGRLYATYVERLFNNKNVPYTDNTVILLKSSDDAGLSWPSGTRRVNDDNALRDGYSEGNISVQQPDLSTPAADRPKFMPNVAVDSATGTVVLSWYDGRDDAARARVSTYLTTSIDGGQTFSPNVPVGPLQTATDVVTGKTVTLNPYPENQSSSIAEPVAAFGTHQGLAVFNGKAYPAWTANSNNYDYVNNKPVPLQIRTANVTFASGPRVVSSTMGPIGLPADALNNKTRADGTPMLTSFQVTFDRPIDPSSLNAGDILVQYRDSAGSAAVPVPVSGVAAVNPGPLGASTFTVSVDASDPKFGIGTYSYLIGSAVHDRLKTSTAAGATTGQFLDQNPGGSFDFYAAPSPAGAAFNAPYSQDTLPLIVPGPHVLGGTVPNSSGGLVLNGTAGSIDVTFDRDMNPATITPASVLRMIGPVGQVNGPFTVQQVSSRVYRIGFPTQTLSGSYTLTLASTITDAKGNALDTNLNAGLDQLRGVVTGPTTPLTYNSADVPRPLADGLVTVSTLNVPDSYLAQGVVVQLDITHPSDPDLQITLQAPDYTPQNNHQVVLVARGTGATGTQANFSGTVFDENATTLIVNGGPPFFGRFKPQFPLTNLNGVQVNGSWKLVVDDASANSSGATGRINSWSLTFQKGVSSTGLGEPVADQATVGFRVFTMDPTNRQSATTWTPVGPAPTASGAASGRIGGIALDPSDPSGNTVFVGGASGGVWKTSNFLTTDPAGPTYVPLTDFGPTLALNIGGLTVLGRNNDTRQSIVIAGTGEGDTTFGFGGNTSAGVGFIISKDGGTTWGLFDSTNNALPFAQRDHVFAVNGGTSTMKVVVDPRLTSNGQAIIYAAMKGPNGGLWRSVDTGTTWQRMSDPTFTEATDVTLDLSSATVDTAGNPIGNVNVIYAAFPGHGVYISPNRGQVLNPLISGNVTPLILDNSVIPPKALAVNNVVSPIGAAGGRIVLAKPALLPSTAPRTDIENKLYSQWLYAAVATPGGTLDGVYLTKDNGQTWTRLKIGTLPSFTVPKQPRPTNNPTQGDYDVLSSFDFNHGNYDITLAVDPTNPNITYFGGTNNYSGTGLVRLDATTTYDTHAVVAYDPTRPDGGQAQNNTTGRMVVDSKRFFGFNSYLSLTDNPGQPFSSDSTYYVFAAQAFTNDGSGTKWTPFDQLVNGTTNLHRVVSLVDPLTGRARLIFGGDQGIFSGVDAGKGTLDPGIGNAVAPSVSRNGNLQLGQIYYGAAQPSNQLISGQLAALFYGNSQSTGQSSSDPGVLDNGNLVGTGSGGISVNFGASTELDGTGIAVDQQGRDIVYRYYWPALGGGFTNFFQVSTDGGKSFVSRTSGLVQTGNDPQWPLVSPSYANGITVGNFAVNPIAGDQVLISSNAGRIFATTDQGVSWLSIGEPGSLDGTYAPALAYGAPDPKAPGGIGNLDNFLYAGTVGGKVFVSVTGGGGNAGSWLDISTGLDGSPVVKIVTDPTRGNHDAYAVTQNGVYYMPDSVPSASNPTPTWINITSNLFALSVTPFNQFGATQPRLAYLSSIQADWRYAIPNAVAAGNGTGGPVPGPATHPILYVSGEAGVFRSLDSGATWTPFPDQSIDGAPVDGGYLPNAHVTDLTTSLGKIDPTSGRPVAQAGDPNVLLATTFGRGQFAIHLAPLVLPSTLALDTKLPAPNGSVGTGTDPQGNPIVNVAQPVIDGFSEQTAFGNTVRITLLDLTNPSNPIVIGGYDPSLGTTNNPTDVPANYTDSAGRFSVQVNATGFNTNGAKTIGVVASDASGTVGNTATLQFTLNAKLTSQNAPPTPTLQLSPASDSSGGFNITNVTNPVVIGSTDPGVKVQVTIVSVNGVAQNTPLPVATTDTNGNYSVQLPTEAAGTYVLKAVATNPTNNLSSQASPLLTFTIKTTGPTSAPTLALNPADDTGIKGDNVTSARLPHFIGTTAPNAFVSLYASRNGVPIPPALAQTRADANGNFSVQLPTALSDGTITLQVTATDAAGNPAPAPSTPLTVTIVSALADYSGAGRTTPAVFRRNTGGNPNANAAWIFKNLTSATGIVFGSSTQDVPLVGDFDGDGITDKALYRPSAGAFLISRSALPGETLSLATYNAPGSLPTTGDFDGDGKTDVGLFNPANGQWTLSETTSGLQQVIWNSSVYSPLPGDTPVPGDYNSTGRSELAVYRALTGQFFIQAPGKLANGQDNIQVVTLSTGAAGDLPVPGNYHDSLTQHQTIPAVYNPSTGKWLVQGDAPIQFNPGDIPAPGDYDGLGRTETAVYRPVIAAFAVNGPSGIVKLGAAGDIPVTAPLAYRTLVTSVPTLSLLNSTISGGTTTPQRHPIFAGTTDPGATVDLINGNGTVVNGAVADSNGRYAVGDPATLANGNYTYTVRAHGISGTVGPVSAPLTVHITTVQGDYIGTGATQPALFGRSGTNLTVYVQNFKPLNGKTIASTGRGDVPLVGDFLGNGTTQVVVFTPSTGNWTLEQASTGYAPQTFLKNFGTGSAYIPAPLDYLGIGKDLAAVYETTTGKWFVQGLPGAVAPIVPFKAGDLPVPGNYDNTGKDELALYRPSTQTWYVAGPFGTYAVGYGGVNDIPVPGNYFATAANQAATEAVWRPSTGQYYIRTASGGTVVDTFKPGDLPAPGDYDGIGLTEAAVFRPSTGQFLVMGPNERVPRAIIPANQPFGGPGLVPLAAPYAFRTVPVSGAVKIPAKTTVKAASFDLGASAVALGTPAPSRTRSSAPAASVTSNRTRPAQVTAVKVAAASQPSFSPSASTPKKGA